MKTVITQIKLQMTEIFNVVHFLFHIILRKHLYSINENFEICVQETINHHWQSKFEIYQQYKMIEEGYIHKPKLYV